MLRRVVVLVLVVIAASDARAAVTGFQVIGREDVPGYPYERITARVTYSVDPGDVHNRVVGDLDKAPRGADGRVTFHGDIVIVRPKTGGNGVAIIDVANRGSATVFALNKPRTAGDTVGDGFLWKRGFTVVVVGWE